VRDFSRPDDKLDTVLGLTVDPRRQALFAVSTNGFEDSAKIERRNAVLHYDLRSRPPRSRPRCAAAKQLNDVAVAPDGRCTRPTRKPDAVFGCGRANRC
jgi:hypothetical protein